MITLKKSTIVDTPQPDPTNPAEWLQAKIDQYQADVTRLEAELKHAQVLLRGHQIWLDEVNKPADNLRK